MAALLVGYARCSTEQQDLTAQREGLLGLGVDPLRVYVDHGLTRTRDRPGLREADLDRHLVKVQPKDRRGSQLLA